MVRLSAIVALALCLVVSACGESAEEKAQSTVCSARADIKQQTDELKGMTLTTATLDGVRANLNAIRDDLDTIVGAQQIQTALQGLATSYEQSLAPIDCP